jgi:large subunit ribosomal protein L17e
MISQCFPRLFRGISSLYLVLFHHRRRNKFTKGEEPAPPPSLTGPANCPVPRVTAPAEKVLRVIRDPLILFFFTLGHPCLFFSFFSLVLVFAWPYALRYQAFYSTNRTTMPKSTFYSREADAFDATKIAKAKASSLRVHFKNMREVGHALQGMNVKKAQNYLADVVNHKQAIPFKRFTGGCGRHAQGKNQNAPGSQVGWPVKACTHFQSLLTNVIANADLKGLDTDNCVIKHVQVNRAVKQRRRTYRAHGRINPYMSNPSHVEMIIVEQGDAVAKAKDTNTGKITRKTAAKNRLKVKAGSD